jgi:hypothetical protein
MTRRTARCRARSADQAIRSILLVALNETYPTEDAETVLDACSQAIVNVVDFELEDLEREIVNRLRPQGE